MVALDNQMLEPSDTDMTVQKIRAAISTPISQDNPVGERVMDDPLFDFVESQMMKVGSLSHGEVRWNEVETAILSLMENKTKDLKLLVHLLQCFQSDGSVGRFVLSLQVLSDFMSQYWETCFPAPGSRGQLPRKKYFNQISQRFDAALDKLVSKQEYVSETNQRELKEALALFQKVTNEAGVEGEESLLFIRKAERWLESCALVDSSAQSNNNTQSSASANDSSEFSPASTVAVDTSNDKATKESLKKVADYLAEFEHGYAQSIRLRRFAIWMSITTPPDANAQGETPLRAMAADRVNEYLEQSQARPDLALWRKVEQSLTNAPFWFDGQYLSAQIATKLGKAEWASAILEETQNFLSRVPELADMSFKGGTPFLSKDTREWLASNEKVNAISSVSSWDDKRQEAITLAKEGGLSVAMAMLNDGLATASEPRDQFYWRLISADLLANQGLDAIARQHYQSLYKMALESSVQDWEPTLINQLEKIVVTE